MEEQQELPQGWVWTGFAQLAAHEPNALKAGPFGSALKKEYYVSEGYKIYGQEQVIRQDAFYGDYFIDEARYEALSSCKVKPGDILISLVGTIGKVLILPEGIMPGIINPRLVKLSLDKQTIKAEFAKFYLDSPTVKSRFSTISHGGTMDILNLSTLRELPVPLPPLPEQRRIVAKLEELFSKLDAGVAAVRRTQALLKRYRQSVLHAAVTGELTRAWREAHPAPAETGAALLERICAERRAQWEAAQVAKRGGQLPLGNGWKSKYVGPEAVDAAGLPELPEGWVWASVEQLVSVGTGATPLKGNPLYHSEGTIPWVTSGALNHLFIREAQQFITELAVEETNAKVFPAGTLLVAMYGEGKTRGKVSELTFDAATNQACAALIFDDASMDVKEMVKLFFEKNYDDLRRLSSGGVQPNLNLSLIKATAVPLPPLAEQAEIVAEVERRLTVLDALSQTLIHELKRAERLRQSILHRAFTGRLVPQDTTDEPAAALLARLRETPAAPAKTKAGRGRTAVAQQTTLGL